MGALFLNNILVYFPRVNSRTSMRYDKIIEGILYRVCLLFMLVCKVGGSEYSVFDVIHNIFTHAPRKGCDLMCWIILWNCYISTHTPLAGCDQVRPPG